MFRKGSLLVWEDDSAPPTSSPVKDEQPVSSHLFPLEPGVSLTPLETIKVESEETANNVAAEGSRRKRKEKPVKVKRRVVVVHDDLIGDDWWETGRGAGILQG
jgi:hypothetical protein